MKNPFTNLFIPKKPKTPEEIAEERKPPQWAVFSVVANAFWTTDITYYQVTNTDPYIVQYKKDLSQVFTESDPRLR
jgi:hypothetical protein